jgi:hypothetical protein
VLQTVRPPGFSYGNRGGSEIFATPQEFNFKLKSTLDSVSAAARATEFLTNFSTIDPANLKLEGSTPKSVGHSVVGQPMQQHVWGYTVGFQNTWRGIPVSGDRVLVDFSGNQVARCVIRRLVETKTNNAENEAPVKDPASLLARWKATHPLAKSLGDFAKFDVPTLLLIDQDTITGAADLKTRRGGTYLPSWRFTLELNSASDESQPRKYLWFHATTGEFLGETPE